MNTKVFILLSWTILLLSGSCESGTQDITEKITTAIMETKETTTGITNPTVISADTEITKSTNNFIDTPLVLCQCGPGEVMDDTGQCQHWKDGTTVGMISSVISTESHRFDTSKFYYYTIINKTQCQYHQIELQEDEFALRQRGDLFVREGNLRGLQVEEYCIHHQQEGDQVKITARGCVSEPEIPRCCPPGEHMVNDDCVRKSTTFMLFDPPLSTGMHGNEAIAGAPFPWSGHQEQVNKPICPPEHIIKKVRLDGHKSYLAVLPKFVLLTWEPERDTRQYKLPEEYCVDVLEDDDSYYAYSCLRTEISKSTNDFIDTPLVLCQCGPGEVMDDTGQCQHWKNGTTVVMISTVEAKVHFESHRFDTSKFLDYTIINKMQCQYHQIELQEDEFALRERGDLFVREGNLRGLRVEEYCIHHQQEGDQVKITARGCVSKPEIPRCCPPGEHMVNGDCVRKSTTFMLFDPPLSTGMYSNEGIAGAPFPWSGHQEQVNKPICPPDHIQKKVRLDGHKSYLAVLPNYVFLTWEPERDTRQYKYPEEYCVDVLEDDDSYYAYSCLLDLDTICKKNTCTRKCCPEGQVYSHLTKDCSISDLPFKPPFLNPPSSLRIQYLSFPSCEFFTHIFYFQLLQDGTLVHNNNEYSFDKFCTDTFIVDNAIKDGALACIKEIQPTTLRKVKNV